MNLSDGRFSASSFHTVTRAVLSMTESSVSGKIWIVIKPPQQFFNFFPCINNVNVCTRRNLLPCMIVSVLKQNLHSGVCIKQRINSVINLDCASHIKFTFIFAAFLATFRVNESHIISEVAFRQELRFSTKIFGTATTTDNHFMTAQNIHSIMKQTYVFPEVIASVNIFNHLWSHVPID